MIINEIVTEPRQDWSAGSFDDPSPGGSPGSDDEWIELYINEGGLNLSDWTIDLEDGTDVTGGLLAGGAFQVSNYIPSSVGSITNTEIGDFLILGNVAGSEEMNNTSLTITLRDGTSAIIDQVVIGSAAPSAPSGNSTDITDESVSKIPGETDTNDDVNDFVLTRATLGSPNSPTGIVKINEVVTNPQQDWNDDGFNGIPGMDAPGNNDEWIELYIETAGLNLTKWTMSMTDGSDVEGTLETSGDGVFNAVNYVGTGSFFDTDAGDYLVLGDPTGDMINSVLIILFDSYGNEIDRVQLGGLAGQAPSGNATSVEDESVCRYVNAIDTDTDDADFIQTISTLGTTNSPTGIVVINEVVTDPVQDWSTNDFDGTVSNGTVSDVDEWVELYIGTAGINLTDWTFNIEDGSGDLIDQSLEAGGAFTISNYSGSGSFLSTITGDYLVMGNVTGSGTVQMNNDVLLTLKDAYGTIIDQVQLGGGAGEAPDGASSGVLDESVSRMPDGADTDNHVNDFTQKGATLGISNDSVLPVTLLDFYAKKNHNGIELIWYTATELNNEKFIVERSRGGSQFESIGELPGAGNSNDVLEYSFLDVKPFEGQNFYRLKQIDFDGAFEYLPIVRAENNFNLAVVIYPNPFEDRIHLGLEESELETTVTIYDLGGLELFEEKYQPTDRFITIEDLKFNPGNYILEVAQDFSHIKMQIVREE